MINAMATLRLRLLFRIRRFQRTRTRHAYLAMIAATTELEAEIERFEDEQ